MPRSTYQQRRGSLRDSLASIKADSLLVSALPNIRHLTGFTGSNAALLLTPSGDTLFTDPRYALQSRQETDCRVAVVRGPLNKAILARVQRQRLRRLGFENLRASYAFVQALREKLPMRTSLVEAKDIVERSRLVKDEEELALIRESVAANSRALSRAVRSFRPGIREVDAAMEIEYEMRRLGADGPAFDTIVAAGARTALPHAHPTGNLLASNELLLVDMGVMKSGYASDMTRMFHFGAPSAKTRKQYRAVLEAQLAAVDKVRAGVTAGAVDRSAREVLKKQGLDKLFTHSTGHGLGLEIHEAPRLGRKDKTRLEAGMVITIEPGIYEEGWGGIRIEDTVLVTATGAQVLTPTPKELVVL